MWIMDDVYAHSIHLLLLITLALSSYSWGLRDVHLKIPLAVRRGENVHLICNYDLENDTLYSVKWYKGRREFYRYLPKENPAMKLFALTGITVDRSQSNASHVLLKAVEPNISGKFSCEVSADAPSFHTAYQTAEMEIVELPKRSPVITGISSRYRHGDRLRGNCTSYHSKPVANLTWTINDVPAPVNRSHGNHLNISLESTSLELDVLVSRNLFNNSESRLILKCTARVHDIYEETVEKIIEEEISNDNIDGSESSIHGPNSYQVDPLQEEKSSDQDGLLSIQQRSVDTSSARSAITITTTYMNAIIIHALIILAIGSLLMLKIHRS